MGKASKCSFSKDESQGQDQKTGEPLQDTKVGRQGTGGDEQVQA